MLKAILSMPLIINVSQIASYLPEFRYRGPFNDSYPFQEVTSEFIINDADMEKNAVLFFDDKIHEGFTSIASDYPTPELAAIFTGLPQELVEPLTTSLKTTKLELPSLSATELGVLTENPKIYKHFKRVEIVLMQNRSKTKIIEAELYKAICEDNADTTKKIVSENPELVNISNIQHDYGRTPLNLALHRHKYHVAELLITKANVNIPDEGGTMPLHQAAFAGNLPLVKLLVDAGADLNVARRSDYGRTALNTALYMNRLDVADYLVTKGADLSIPDAGGNTPLKNIMKMGHFKTLDTTLEEKLDLSNASSDLESLFHKISLMTKENETKKNKNETSIGKVSQSSLFTNGLSAYRRILKSFAELYQDFEEVGWDFHKLKNTSDRRLIESCIGLPFQLKDAFSLIGQGLRSENIEERKNAVMACKLFDNIIKNGFKYGLFKTELYETMKKLYPDKVSEMETNIKLIISGELELQNLIITVQIGEVLRMNGYVR